MTSTTKLRAGLVLAFALAIAMLWFMAAWPTWPGTAGRCAPEPYEWDSSKPGCGD